MTLLAAERNNHTITAYRVLVVLKILFEQGAIASSALNDALQQSLERGLSSETLTKYINTLRHVGCVIPRATQAVERQYQLRMSPFAMPVTEEEADALMRALTETFLHPGCQPEWLSLWFRVLWALDLPAQSPLADARDNLMQTQHSASIVDSSTASQWQQYCQAGFALAITYAPPQLSQSFQLCLDPMAYRAITPDTPTGGQLTGVCRQTGEERVLHTAWIQQVRQLPVRRQNRQQVVRVVFALRGKLARTYRPYPGETLVARPHPDCVQMAAHTSQVDVLLQRLMKYGALCEVISPTYLRKQVAQRVRAMAGFNARFTSEEHRPGQGSEVLLSR